MAQNLNYQKGLTWQENADSLTSNLSGHTDQIGSFWCPGAAGAATSTLEDCDIHGAVYAWPTAMLCDGTGVYTRLWPWLEGRLNDADAKFNNCRTCEGKPGGRGICPAGWHVPTAFEWAKIYDYMENPGSTIYQTVSRFAPCIGENAARNMKSRLSCTPAPDVVCPKNAWLNTTSSFVPGTDKFNFNAQPAPMRNYTKPFVWVANGVHWLSANESYWEGPLIYGVGANNLCSAAEHIHPGRGANVRCIAD